MNTNEYIQYDGLGLAQLVAKKEVTSTELLHLALARANALNPQLNAIVYRFDKYAEETAKGNLRGNFAGVPFLVKNLFQDVANQPASCGSRSLKYTIAKTDSDYVKRLKQNGLVIFGSTNTPEFGAKSTTEPEAFQAARNPWNLAHTTGGSSGGSAAAVAARIVPIAGANDGGGSIRIPAACCGLFGLKPARGKISAGPHTREAILGIATQGVITRTVRDAAAMLDILQGSEPHSPYYTPETNGYYLDTLKQTPKKLKIGFTTQSPLGTKVDAEAINAVMQAVKMLVSMGHHVEECQPDIDGRAMSRDFLTLWFVQQANIAAHIQQETGRALFELDTKIMAALGKTVSGMELVDIFQRYHLYTQKLTEFYNSYDLLLTPTIAAPPLHIGALKTPKLLQLSGLIGLKSNTIGLLRHTSIFEKIIEDNLAWTPFTILANVTGRPAMSVPLYWTPNNLPLGVQFIAGLNKEDLLLRLAYHLEQVQPWIMRKPMII